MRRRSFVRAWTRGLTRQYVALFARQIAELLLELETLLEIVLSMRIDGGCDDISVRGRPLPDRSGWNAGPARRVSWPEFDPAADRSQSRFPIGEFDPESCIRRRGQFAVVCRHSQTRADLAPDVRHENPTGAQFYLGKSSAHVGAGFIAVFREANANDLNRGLAIELNETVWEECQGKSRTGRSAQDLPPAGILGRAQLGKSAAVIGTDGDRTFKRKDSRQRLASRSLPAAAFT